MSKLYTGSIDLMKINKSQLEEFTRKNGDKGKSMKVAIWIDDDATEDWKQCSIQQNTPKGEDNINLGNAKKR